MKRDLSPISQNLQGLSVSYSPSERGRDIFAHLSDFSLNPVSQQRPGLRWVQVFLPLAGAQSGMQTDPFTLRVCAGQTIQTPRLRCVPSQFIMLFTDYHILITRGISPVCMFLTDRGVYHVTPMQATAAEFSVYLDSWGRVSLHADRCLPYCPLSIGEAVAPWKPNRPLTEHRPLKDGLLWSAEKYFH